MQKEGEKCKCKCSRNRRCWITKGKCKSEIGTGDARMGNRKRKGWKKRKREIRKLGSIVRIDA